MVAGLAGRVFAFFADLMRRLAVVLDRAAGRPEPALALLMHRFPGAPEQWLRDIAGRMPQLVEETPLPPPPPPLDIPRAAPRKSLHLDLSAEAEPPPASPLSLRKGRDLRRHPRLKFFDVQGQSDQSEAPRWDASAPTPRSQLRQEAAARKTPQPLRLPFTALFTRRPEKPALAESSPRPSPVLHLADRGAAAAVELPPLLPRAADEPASPRAIFAARAPKPATEPEWAGPRRLPATTLALSPSARKPAPEPHWIAALPKTRASFRPLSYELRWPELPQVIHSVRDEHLPEPRFDELRREQEVGLWNA